MVVIKYSVDSVYIVKHHTISGMETASHAGHCPINLVNVW